LNAAVLSADRILQLGNAFRQAKALLSAVELDVFTELGAGPLDLAALRAKTGIHERGARDFFDTLVALGLLDRGTDGRYANMPDADLYLVRGKPTYLGELLNHLSAQEYPRWNLLTRALKTGQAHAEAGENGSYLELYREEAGLKSFAQAMSGGSFPVARALAARFPWQDHRTLIDIGTAEGCVPVVIVRAYPHIVGGGFDLPAVGALFESNVREHALSDRLRFFPGDFLTDPLPPADVLIMGRVLHNWDLPTKKMLLAKAYRAIRAGGALIVYERLIDDARRTGIAGLLASLNMLVMTTGGFDYSGGDCLGWMQQAGFRDMRVEPLTSDQSMIVGMK
jgi:hypothetical protein